MKELVTVISPRRNFTRFWRELWDYRELFLFLSWRDILARYKQTIVGGAWCIIRPFLTMVVFSIIFGQLAKFPTEGNVPYPILVYTAMLPWQFFATSFANSGNSLILNAHIISKVYFPRVLVPASSVFVCLVDFSISVVVFVGLMIWYGFMPNWKVIFVPLFLLLVVVFSLGLGLLLGALNVKYRDFKNIIPFMVQLGLYISPVGFSSSIIPEKWRLLYSLNPMVGVIDGFRWATLGDNVTFAWQGILLSCIVSILFLAGGLWYFMKTEKFFADVI